MSSTTATKQHLFHHSHRLAVPAILATHAAVDLVAVASVVVVLGDASVVDCSATVASASLAWLVLLVSLVMMPALINKPDQN